MKVIVDGKPLIVRLFGRQKIKDAEYRLMNYVLINHCEDGTLMHNSITGMLVLLSEEEERLLNTLPAMRSEAMSELIENHFLVPVSYDERDTVQKLRKLVRHFDAQIGIESYTILTTTNCNARCFYCYESDLPHVNMDESTADKLVDFMVEHKGRRPLQLHWFGGEPLVCVNRIDQITKALTDRGVRFVSSMTSNGYLFTDEIVLRAVELWKLGSVQITLDGTEEVYNRTKAYVGIHGSPYRRVLENIKRLLSRDIRVVIRLNLDKHNADDLNSLVSELNEIIDDRSKIEVYSHILFEDAGFTPIERDDESRAMLYSRQIQLNQELERLGLGRNHRALPFLKTHNCMADTEHAAVVYPDGRLFKCEHVAIGDEYDSLYESIANPSGVEKYQVETELESCRSCPLYPGCVLLKHCPGIPDKNEYTCRYDVNQSVRSLQTHYIHYKQNSSEPDYTAINEC